MLLLAASLAAAAAPLTAIDVPFQRLPSGHIVVPVTLDGHTAPFVVDSGASVTVVKPSTWEAAGHDANAGAKAGAAGAGGRVTGVRVVSIPTIAVDGNPVHLGFGVVMDIATGSDAAGDAADHGFGGILGADVLRQYVVEVDFDAQRLRLLPEASAAPVAWVPARRLRGGLTGVDVRVGDSTVPAIVDLGADATILNLHAAALPGVAAVPDCGHGALGADAHVLELRCATVPGLVVGGRALGGADATSVSVSDLPVFRVMRLGSRPAMILGLDRLGHGTLVLDARHRRIGYRE